MQNKGKTRHATRQQADFSKEIEAERGDHAPREQTLQILSRSMAGRIGIPDAQHARQMRHDTSPKKASRNAKSTPETRERKSDR
ncbi:hypothetical protein GCM10007920_41100 [Ciceribacter naphthalenivorans]|uniref:Uncharacterized protein n=2 Tax=Alphaproteobacteria TaxID=28211 RepID=A0A512HDJ9_9HYPH|nr:hypothetical protein RNA01_04650 [Ciceribacter naphthalenivorans]GLR24316.1 hypothetical protein GCM10007920_41100 [Ciceribacter naphthalenivorans]GLT07172.1 hypothetical protein GCM10007926_41100 [Sphingomonas psychrolutea]